MEPKLTTLKQDTVKLGSYAAQKLIGQIERPKTSVPEIIVVEGEVYEGRSVGILNKDKFSLSLRKRGKQDEIYGRILAAQ